MSETTEVLFQRYGPHYRIYVTVVALVGSIAAIITTTTVNVAIPDIMGAFGIGLDRAQWLSTGALIGVTIGMLMSAWLVESFGQRLIFVGSLVLFTAALILAGLSPNDTILIIARAIQGLIAGVLQTLAMTTLFNVFPPERRGTAMGFFSINVILGPALGPTLGGVLIEYFSWRAVFFMAIPPAVVAILLGVLFMPERETTTTRARFDWTGFIWLTVLMTALLSALANGQRAGWGSDFIIALFALSFIAGALFVYWELRSPQPLVNLRVFATPQFSAAVIVGAIFGVGAWGVIYLIPLFVQAVQGLTAFDAALALLPGSLAMAVVMPLCGFLTDRLPARLLMITGLLLFAVSSYWLGAIDTNTSFWVIAWFVTVGRIAQAFINPALNVTALHVLPHEELRQGAGMINFSRQLGGAFGVSLLSVALDRRTALHGDALASAQVESSAAGADLLRTIEGLLAQGGVAPNLQAQGALHYLGRVIHQQAVTLAYQDSFLIVAAVFVLALVPAWMMGNGTKRKGPLKDH